MKKFLILIAAASMIMIVGCDNEEAGVNQAPGQIETNNSDFNGEESKLPVMPALQVDNIQQISIAGSNNGNEDLPSEKLAVLENSSQFQLFADAIANSPLATGEVISIGANYDFIVESASSQQRFSYWNGKYLKMISDHTTKKSYFLSDEAVQQIDGLLHEAGISDEPETITPTS